MEGAFNLGDQRSDNSRGSENRGSQHGSRVEMPGNPSSDSLNTESEKLALVLFNGDKTRNKVGSVHEGGVAGDSSGLAGGTGHVSLRQWLDRPGRSVNPSNCFRIFRQIVEMHQIAHSRGVALPKARPSCFVMSSFNYASFIESASRSGSGSDDRLNNQIVDAKKMSTPLPLDMQQQRSSRLGPVIAPINTLRGTSRKKSSVVAATQLSPIDGSEPSGIREKRNFEAEEKNNEFLMKTLLAMENTWYSTPEELAGAPSSCASDIYRLGVLLFELYCPASSWEKKCEAMSGLKHRVLDTQLLQSWPNEASFCMLLMHPDPTGRPTISDVLQSNYFNASRDNLEECKAAVELKGKANQHDLLMEFFQMSQYKLQEGSNRTHHSLSFVRSDVEEVTNHQDFQNSNMSSISELGKYACSVSNIPLVNVSDNDGFASSRKRLRIGPQINSMAESSDNLNDSKNSRMMQNFNELELVYLSTRFRASKSLERPLLRISSISSGGRGSGAVTERSSANNSISNDNNEAGRKIGCINPLLEGLCKYLRVTQLKVKAELKQGDLLNSTNLVCSLGFDRDGEYFASAGTNKKIKVFDYKTISPDRDIHYPVAEMISESKLSSICWNGYIKSHIASSNFEGVVQVWDGTRSQVLRELKEHERRVWSVDFSSVNPTLLASGSDDGSVKIWNINQAASIVTIKANANVCCVQFPMDSGRSLAFGSADHMIHYYDLRSARSPLFTFFGHNRTVSSIKFVDAKTFVSSSTDNTIKLWDLSTCTSRMIDAVEKMFTGHTNVKNFVGLSVADGYIATGSETNEAFVYHKDFPMPALSVKFNTTDPLSGCVQEDALHFVTSVCWRPQSPILLAANSTGNIKVLEME